jgi:hypothetical protein
MNCKPEYISYYSASALEEMKRVTLCAAFAVVASIIPPAYSFWGDPDVEVPAFSSVEEACKSYLERRRIARIEEKPLRTIQYKNDQRKLDGEPLVEPPDRFKERAVRAWKRERAGEIAVLRAMGYQDWKMYSRYSKWGIGDLFQKVGGFEGYIKIARDKSHPHNKYVNGEDSMETVRMVCDSDYRKLMGEGS